MTEALKVLSLFSGVGGFDLGLEQSGMKTVALCEWDRKCQSVLCHHWPDVPIFGDVSELTGDELLSQDIYPDVVAFGSPCQDLSLAGKRRGLEGSRSGLFHQAIRIIKELQNAGKYHGPRWVVWENVAGALSSANGRDFGRVLDELADLGSLVIEWGVLDAQNFGVPQRRRRVFVVACLDPRTSERVPSPLLPLAEGRPRDLATRRRARKDAPRTIEESPDEYLIGTPSRRNGIDLGDGVCPTLLGFMGTGGNNVPIVTPDYETIGTLTSSDLVKGQTNYQSLNAGLLQVVHGLAGNTIGRQPHNGGNGNGFSEPGEAFYTLTATDRHAVSITNDKTVVRRLTPRECERLMGWPDDWTRYNSDGKELSDSPRYKMIGNGVASPVAKWVGDQIMAVERD